MKNNLVKIIMALIIVLVGLAILYASSAFAGDVTITWTNPTKNEDGSNLTNLAKVRIYYDTNQTGTYTNFVDYPTTTVGSS